MISRYAKYKQLTNRCDNSANRHHALPHGPVTPSAVIAPQSAAAAATTIRKGVSASTGECVDLIPTSGPAYGGKLAKWPGTNSDGMTYWKTHICPGENVILDYKNIEFLGGFYDDKKGKKLYSPLVVKTWGWGPCGSEPGDGHCTLKNDAQMNEVGGCNLHLGPQLTGLQNMLTGNCERSCGILLQPRPPSSEWGGAGDQLHCEDGVCNEMALYKEMFPPEGVDVSFILPIIHKKTGVHTKVLFHKDPFHWYDGAGFFENPSNQNWNRLTRMTPWNFFYAETKEVRAARKRKAAAEAPLTARAVVELKEAVAALETAIQEQNKKKHVKLEPYTNISYDRSGDPSKTIGSEDNVMGYDIAEGVRIGEPVDGDCNKYRVVYYNIFSGRPDGIKVDDITLKYSRTKNLVTEQDIQHSINTTVGFGGGLKAGYTSPFHVNTSYAYKNEVSTTVGNTMDADSEITFQDKCVYDGTDDLFGTCSGTGNKCNPNWVHQAGTVITSCPDLITDKVGCCPQQVPCPASGKCPTPYGREGGVECEPNSPEDEPEEWNCSIENDCVKNQAWVQALEVAPSDNFKKDETRSSYLTGAAGPGGVRDIRLKCSPLTIPPACPPDACPIEQRDLTCQQCTNNNWLDCKNIAADTTMQQACIDGLEHDKRMQDGTQLWPLQCTDNCTEDKTNKDWPGASPGLLREGEKRPNWVAQCKKNRDYIDKYKRCPGAAAYPWDPLWRKRKASL